MLGVGVLVRCAYLDDRYPFGCMVWYRGAVYLAG